MDGWMDGLMDGWTDGRTDGWMDGWMDGFLMFYAQSTTSGAIRATQNVIPTTFSKF